MTDDKAGQVQSKLSARGMKRDVKNTPKCTRSNCILARRSSLGPPPVRIPSLLLDLRHFTINSAALGHPGFKGRRSIMLLQTLSTPTAAHLKVVHVVERLGKYQNSIYHQGCLSFPRPHLYVNALSDKAGASRLS